jgi:uncharacterized membrane protein
MTEEKVTPSEEPAAAAADAAEAEAPVEVEITSVSAAMVAVDEASGVVSAATLDVDASGALMTGIVADEDGILAEGAVGVNAEGYAIVVARFANEDAAKGAYTGLLEAESAGALDIEGVLVARADTEGKIHIVKMTDHKTRNGFLAGAVAGGVIGILFPPAILASALWLGAGGAAIGKLRNLGARNKVAKDLASVLTPGSSGIIALAKLAQVDDVQKALPKAEEVKAAAVTDETAATVKKAAEEAGAAPEA